MLWLQLGNVHLDNKAADMNVSAVALAAVDIAATALDSALLSVERTVERSQQRPEVSNHAVKVVCVCMHCSPLVAMYMISISSCSVGQTHQVIRRSMCLCSSFVLIQVCI